MAQSTVTSSRYLVSGHLAQCVLHQSFHCTALNNTAFFIAVRTLPPLLGKAVFSMGLPVGTAQ